jgi:hypothetical protein
MTHKKYFVLVEQFRSFFDNHPKLQPTTKMATAAAEEDFSDYICPICLRDDDDDANDDNASTTTMIRSSFLVHGPCRHKFCLPCLQQVFAAPSQNNPHHHRYSIHDGFYIPTQDDLLNVPTMGRCPVCRTTLCLLDLKTTQPKPQHPQRSPPTSRQISGGSVAAPTTTRSSKNSSFAETDKHEHAVASEMDISRTDLAGLVFVKRRRREGEESIHFPCDPSLPPSNRSISTLTTIPLSFPYVSFENININHPNGFDDDGIKWTTPKKYFDPKSCRYHKDSRTFHGLLRWDDDDHQHIDTSTSECDDHHSDQNDHRDCFGGCKRRFHQSDQWEYILNFSSDLRYVARGVLIKHRNPCRRSDCARASCKFPLDGEWSVEWPVIEDENSGDSDTDDPQVGPQTTKCGVVQVHGNAFLLRDENFSDVSSFLDRVKPSGRIEFSDHSLPSLVLAWISDDVDKDGPGGSRQNASPDFKWDPASRPEGPAVGESIEWTGISKRYPKMIWRRKTIAPNDVPLQVVKFGEGGILYHRLGAIVDDSAVRAMYYSDRLWGNSFCQAMTVGLASYHFTDEGNAYISYEHERTSVWPNLDNGQPIPSRISFTDTSFDEERRTFRGVIDWEGTHHTTWSSSRWWR